MTEWRLHWSRPQKGDVEAHRRALDDRNICSGVLNPSVLCPQHFLRGGCQQRLVNIFQVLAWKLCLYVGPPSAAVCPPVLHACLLLCRLESVCCNLPPKPSGRSGWKPCCWPSEACCCRHPLLKKAVTCSQVLMHLCLKDICVWKVAARVKLTNWLGVTGVELWSFEAAAL